MRIATFNDRGQTRLGAVAGDRIVDFTALDVSYDNMIALIAEGPQALAHLAERVKAAPDTAWTPLANMRLCAPLMPSTVLCAGSNYHAHNAEKANTPLSGREPEFFLKTSDCVIGPEDGIVHDPVVTLKLDLETELAVIIGTPGRHIPVDRALDHVFGYTVANDVTARDRQVRQTAESFTWYELGRGKAFDTSLPLGPVILTKDEVPDPQALTLRTRINGELRQQANTSDMIWSCAELIHFFSINFTLKPGMVILTGTPAGTAWSVDKELGGKWIPADDLVAASRYAEPGDIVESEIAEIGVLRNPVVGSSGERA
jgi:2-keto-4-pentenoate hydratase/2-oxohepta-3-ene-1,7-dioic acid hydratase in catechol pathway